VPHIYLVDFLGLTVPANAQMLQLGWPEVSACLTLTSME